jgi:hypothetical protein
MIHGVVDLLFGPAVAPLDPLTPHRRSDLGVFVREQAADVVGDSVGAIALLELDFDAAGKVL